MKYRTAAAFRSALEERLRQRARQGGPSLARLRKHVTFDRLLARLVATAPDRWVLKGALALDLRLPDRSRATKDMDLGRVDDEEQATADLLAATALDLGDFFTFRSERVRDLDDVPEGAAVRYRVRAELAGRAFEDVIVDMVIVSRSTAVSATELQEELDRTFRERASHPLPDRLPPPPADWRRPYARIARDLDIPTELERGHAIAAQFIDPVLQRSASGRWNPAAGRWN